MSTQEQPFDDTHCMVCHKPIQIDPKPGTLAWEGFCSWECLGADDEWVSRGSEEEEGL